MATNIAFDIIARDRASATFNKVSRSADHSHGRLSRLAKGGIAALGIGGLATTLTMVGKNSVKLEAEFSKTMSVLQATTKATSGDMKSLTDLAMKMGAETVFSANDASKAMLELARGGMNAAQIKAGALQGTLTLAAAGELEMGEAANIAVKSMGQFGLKGKQMGSVAAALAGGANASSASVRDMSQALAQGGLAANSVGFSLQETTAVLAAFSNSGLEGSDAGTSLKTMLDRLQPATEGASSALKSLGVITKDGTNRFVKSNGEFKSAAEIAEVLKQGTKDLDQAERKRLITQAFGSDAQRAATIFAKTGADGLNKLTKATSDQDAAEKMAAANMKGTAGAMERLSGAVETAQLKIGLMLAPAVIAVSDALSGTAIPAMVDFVDSLGKGSGKADSFISSLKPVGKTLLQIGGWVRDDLIPAMRDLAEKWLEGVRGMFREIGKSMQDNKPFIDQVKVAFGKLGDLLTHVLMPALGWFYQTAFPLLGKAIGAAITIIKKMTTMWLFMVEHTIRALGYLLNAVLTTFSGILKAAEIGLGWIPGIGGKIKKAKDAFDDFKDSTIANLEKTADKLHAVRDAINQVKSPKPVVISVRYQIPDAPSLIPGINKDRGLGANARGTSYWRGGPTSLHEQGPEIVDLPRGSRVYPAGRSAQMVRDAAASGLSKADMEDAFYRALCRMPVFRLPDAGRGAYQQGAAY